jgi:exodeoxyribonuclease V beta subunit
MEFWVPASRLQASRVDTLCQQHLLGDVPRPGLPARQVNGMLMGFADLVFEHDGRYWVLDYKTNQLGRDVAAYEPSALEAEMARHRYDVQAALYLLALHRLLRARLGSAYKPDQHLGGALYWFVRGIDSPNRGEYAIRADRQGLALIESLDELFQPEDTPC